jgi:hypothetical protein
MTLLVGKSGSDRDVVDNTSARMIRFFQTD